MIDTTVINKPQVTEFIPAGKYAGWPEITDISFDLWMLSITADFEDVNNPVYVRFDGIRGFRVLDEGDLLEFWDPDVRAEAWLWLLEKSG